LLPESEGGDGRIVKDRRKEEVMYRKYNRGEVKGKIGGEK
jgi:hypothetical protein